MVGLRTHLPTAKSIVIIIYKTDILHNIPSLISKVIIYVSTVYL